MVKAVKNAAGCTVNDVVMTICAGALRDWLAERGELPSDPLLTMVPVSVRTPEQRGTFRHFTVNGRREPGPELRLPVTEDLEIVARFGG